MDLSLEEGLSLKEVPDGIMHMNIAPKPKRLLSIFVTC